MSRIACRQERIADASLAEPFCAELTAVAAAARRARGTGIVATAREPVIEVEREASSNDIGLAQIDERRVDVELRAFDAGARRNCGQRLERPDERRAAIRVAGIIERVDANVDIAGVEDFGPAERKRKK